MDLGYSCIKITVSFNKIISDTELIHDIIFRAGRRAEAPRAPVFILEIGSSSPYNHNPQDSPLSIARTVPLILTIFFV